MKAIKGENHHKQERKKKKNEDVQVQVLVQGEIYKDRKEKEGIIIEFATMHGAPISSCHCSGAPQTSQDTIPDKVSDLQTRHLQFP